MTDAAPLAVTMGEPAGIGGELSLKAWSMRRQGDRPFFVLDDAEWCGPALWPAALAVAAYASPWSCWRVTQPSDKATAPNGRRWKSIITLELLTEVKSEHTIKYSRN